MIQILKKTSDSGQQNSTSDSSARERTNINDTILDSSESEASGEESHDETESPSVSHAPVSDESSTDRNITDSNDVEKVVLSNKDLPKTGISIRFKLPEDEEWRHGTVISRGGKASTANWHFMNIKECDQSSCLSLKNATWANETSDSEALYVNLRFDESMHFANAKLDELKKWKDMNVYKEVTDSGQPTISTRWVLTRKSQKECTKYKARLVARGFEEHNPPRTDSPTCSKHFLRLIFALVASNFWSLHSIDIKSAFLQGLPIDRKVFIKPPPEANTKLLWLLLQCPYGLADASRNWYLRVKEVLLSCGLEQLKFDNAVFFWYHDGILQGIVAVHVDDFLYSGTDAFIKQVIAKIKLAFVVGNEESCTFMYLGIHLKCLDNKIQLSMKAYTALLQELNLKDSSNSDRLLTDHECQLLKQSSGQINWAVT